MFTVNPAALSGRRRSRGALHRRRHGKGGAGVDFEFVTVNGARGWVLSRDGAPFAVAAIETDGEKVRKVFATLNPDKLVYVKAPQGASG